MLGACADHFASMRLKINRGALFTWSHDNISPYERLLCITPPNLEATQQLCTLCS